MTSAQDPSEGTERLAGRVAVITGAARGIGYQIALRLGREGMRVVIADLDAPRSSPRPNASCTRRASRRWRSPST